MEKKLKLMRFWLLGVFVILITGLFAFYWLGSGASVAGFFGVLAILKAVWWIFLLIAVLCFGLYFFYKALVTRKK